MSHYIPFTVDTRPMADEINKVSRHVDNTTAAVVSMKAAVVMAEKESADLVCNNVNRGFHALMLSQVSQKTAKLQSEVNSHLLRLNQQSKQLQSIKNRMQRDYLRTTTRYSKLFGTINKELRQRVQELDQPIFKFATTEIQTTTNRMCHLVATAPIMQSESITKAQHILASNLKRHSGQVIDVSKQFIGDMHEQDSLTHKILLSGQESRSATMMVPVAVMESKRGEECSYEVYLSSQLFSPSNQNIIRSEFYQSADSMNWRETEQNAEIVSEFERLLEASSCSRRVKNLARKLMQSANDCRTL